MINRIYRKEQAAGSERETYLDPNDRAGGEAHGCDSEGIRRTEGSGVASEHAKLERLLEQFGDWIRRRSRAEEGRVRPAPPRLPPDGT